MARRPVILRKEDRVQLVDVQNGVFKVRSRSDPDFWYYVNVNHGTCTCIAGVYGFVNCPNKCHHYRTAVRTNSLLRQIQRPVKGDRPMVLVLNNATVGQEAMRLEIINA